MGKFYNHFTKMQPNTISHMENAIKQHWDPTTQILLEWLKIKRLTVSCISKNVEH